MFDIMLYRNTAENNRIDKTNFLSTIATISGTLRGECSIIAPSFDIEMSSVQGSKVGCVIDGSFTNVKANSSYVIDSGLSVDRIIMANYCYIPKFKRYYYITDIVSDRNNLWRLTMSCDVLMSFKSYIYGLDVYVTRQEYNYDNDIIDSKLQAKIKPMYSTIDIVSGTNDLISPRLLSSNSYCFCLITSTNQINETEGAIQTKINVVDPSAATTGYMTGMYALNGVHIDKLGDYLMRGTFFDKPSLLWQSTNEGLISLGLFPFEFFSNGLHKVYGYGTTRNVTKLSIGNGIIDNIGDVNNPIIYYGGNKYCDISLGVINFNRYYNNFLDYSPYTKINLFIPTIGYVELDTDLVMGKSIEVRMCVDVFTNTSNVRLITNNTVIQTYTGTIGLTLPLNSSTANDIAKSLLLCGIKMSVGAGTYNSGSRMNEVSFPERSKYTPKTHQPTAKYQRFSEQQDIRKSNEMINFIGDMGINALSSPTSSGFIGDFGSGWSTYGLPFKMFAYVTRIVPAYFNNNETEYMSKYRRMVGSPSSYNGSLGSLRGYTEVGAVHIEGIVGAVQEELEDIERALRSGVLLPD